MSCCRKIEEGSFQPDYRAIPLTEKFYARHESLEVQDPRRAKVQPSTEIQKGLCYDPEIYKHMPATENQVYGWLEIQDFQFDETCPEVCMEGKFNKQSLPIASIDKFSDVIGARMTYDAREHRGGPLTENQSYGWLEKLAFQYDKRDKVMFKRPRKVCEELRVQLLVFQEMQRARKLNLLK